MKYVDLQIVQGDILTYEADILVLKHAQSYSGAEFQVAHKLRKHLSIPYQNMGPTRGEFKIIETQGFIATPRVLIVGTDDPSTFNYGSISRFAGDGLRYISSLQQPVERVITTIHGTGFGLDETEALISQVAGYLKFLRQIDSVPFKEIVIVELQPQRVDRLRGIIDQYFSHEHSFSPLKNSWGYRIELDRLSKESLQNTATASKLDLSHQTEIEEAAELSHRKKHVFVAMPFKESMDDLFYYGIQKPIRDNGLQCHRIDQGSFSGDIFEQIRRQIDTAAVVVAVLTLQNPNVFLEVGYALGKNIPMILLVDNPQDLPFNVRGQRCLKYSSIKQAEQLIYTELESFKTQGLMKV